MDTNSRQFASNNYLEVTNTFFYRKSDIKKFTFVPGCYRSLVDYLFINDKMSPSYEQLQEVDVHRDTTLNWTHFLLLAKFVLWTRSL